MSEKSKKSRWSNSFLGSSSVQKPFAASNSKVDRVFDQTVNKRPSFDYIDGDTVDFESIQHRSEMSANDRIRASKILEKNANNHIEFDFGISKTASGLSSSNVEISSSTDFYSPWLSTDYLELPRSFSEERRWYRSFYDTDPIVGRSIDLKTFIPLSKMTLGLPRSKSHVFAQKVHSFYENMWSELRMFEKMQWILHEYNLIGEVLIYFEWDDDRRTWSKILILDPDLCEVRYMPFADETKVFLRPDTSIRETIEDLKENNRYSELASTLEEISEDALSDNENSFIELNTDPKKGSFVKYFGRKRSPYRPGPGISVLRRLLRTLLFRDKIRQALTQITSRHMTPVRIVWAEGLGPDEVNALRDQVDLAVMGPDFSLVTNYELNWTEITSDGRLFDATSIFERTTEELLIGLGMTKELLIGEGSYGAGRITLQVLDTEYSLVRELLQEMMNEVFRVAAEKNDFTEKDPDSGLKYVIYSTLKFSRMALRDYADVFDFFWNLYQNGALDKETLLEFFNIDPVDVETKLKNNFLTINDNLADELRRNVYGEAATRLFDSTDIEDRLIDGFGLVRKKQEDDEDMMTGGGEEGMEEPPMPEQEEPSFAEESEEAPPPEVEETPSADLDYELGEYDEFGEEEQQAPIEETKPSVESTVLNDLSYLKDIKLPASPAGKSGPVLK